MAVATIGTSLLRFLRAGVAGSAALAFTNSHLIPLVTFEIVAAAALVPWLRRRGWTPGQVAGEPAPVDLLRGIGLWIGAGACVTVASLPLAMLHPAIARTLFAAHHFTGQPASAPIAMIASVVNPLFEEFLWLGYGVTRLAPSIGLRRASLLSVVLRTSVHLYQGPLVLFGPIPIGLAFTWYYARTRRLWPVVVAHILFDAIGLASRLAGG